ncbi:HbrB-like protein [Aulographum hederae CBS 113979]|uniref:HbrB-like protein n=1 Tax=Aulographum hederae CBS 113979 TaxID=1176131 RepID=A0A6G1HEQ6_9PEZI|nr:HbrB-like protein [Aulographum hederae CBS 113979]
MPPSPAKPAPQQHHSGLNSPINLQNFSTPSQSQTQSPSYLPRNQSISSDSSDSSHISVVKRSPYAQQQHHARSPLASNQAANASSTSTTTTASLASTLPRPETSRGYSDLPLRNQPHPEAPSWQGHRPRQHSQGFFEPSLPTATNSNANAIASAMPNLTASQIAAQAAMHVQNPQHMRKRSQTLPDPSASGYAKGRPVASPPPVPTVNHPSSVFHNSSGFQGGHKMAAATAANAVFPRSPQFSPQPHEPNPPTLDVGQPSKEKSKRKLFMKSSKNLVTGKDRDGDRKPLPSPNKLYSTNTLPRFANASTTSLADSTMSGVSSFYSSANASTSTLVPADKIGHDTGKEKSKEKEKHKHHLWRGGKKDDTFNLPLSSANSTSKPTDPSAPQPLYSFAPTPSSPGHSSSFAKSMTGLDIRHGGRALRDKKKEEKAASSFLTPVASSSTSMLEPPNRERDTSFSSEKTDWTGLGPSSSTNALSGASVAPSHDLTNIQAVGNMFKLSGMTPDDAWPLLKAKLLYIFEGEDPRPPIEEFNALVSIHIRRCIQRRTPEVLVEDLSELLQTGFASLDQTLKHVPDDRLIPHLVEMWVIVLNTILPFLCAVFLPLDLEFKGCGTLLSKDAAQEFWGAMLPSDTDTINGDSRGLIPTLGEELEVRRMVLITFRDTVILPRNDALIALFSQLSLENLNKGIADTLPELPPQPRHHIPSQRPGTAASLDPGFASYNSQSSTLLDSSSSLSAGARSRATSNTSAGSFASLSSHGNSNHTGGGAHTSQQPPQSHSRHRSSHSQPTNTLAPPLSSPRFATSTSTSQQTSPLTSPPLQISSAQITQTVGRMLQCVSILVGVQSGDEKQAAMENLAKLLKHNWLGRGRTGGRRQGIVGMKMSRGVGIGVGV